MPLRQLRLRCRTYVHSRYVHIRAQTLIHFDPLIYVHEATRTHPSANANPFRSSNRGTYLRQLRSRCRTCANPFHTLIHFDLDGSAKPSSLRQHRRATILLVSFSAKLLKWGYCGPISARSLKGVSEIT